MCIRDSKVTLKEQVVDFAPQPVITKDNVTMQIDTVIYYQITDPRLFTYGVDYPISAIENLTATTLRNIIGDLELDETLTSRDIINSRTVSYTHLDVYKRQIECGLPSLTFPTTLEVVDVGTYSSVPNVPWAFSTTVVTVSLEFVVRSFTLNTT